MWPSLLGLEHRPIGTILDIGSHDGATARILKSYFPGATIHCFEPQCRPFERLEAWADTQNGKVICHHVALGERTAKMEMMLNSVATRTSSLLELKTNETSPKDITRTEVDLRSLDDLMAGVSFEEQLLVKIDTEGFEKQVLLGAEITMKKASCCIVEGHAVDRFVGQTPFREIVVLLGEYGFRFAGNIHQAVRKNGMVSHFDAMFIREETVPAPIGLFSK